MRIHKLLAAAAIACASTLGAQGTEVLEVRPFVGASIPTGSQRDMFKNAALFGFQGAFELAPTFHLIGTFGWVPVHHRYIQSDTRANIAQVDLGMEFGAVHALSGGWELRPFVGLGGGGRMYMYSANQLDNTTCASGYGAVGTEFQLRDVALRLEARDNVFCYKAPIAGVASATRNDVGLSFGLAYHFR